MNIRAIKTRVFKPDEKLIPFLEQYYRRPREKDILVVTSKVVALAEGRVIEKWDKEKKKEIICEESELVIPTPLASLTVKDGMVMASAGIDESNGQGSLILLPHDSWAVASAIRRHFCRRNKLQEFGVIITDSRTAPLRAGITGVALGYAGLVGLKDYRRRPDIFGRPFHFSRVDVADSLAAAAVLCMGEGNEQRPLAVITGAPCDFSARVNRQELRISPEEDMYGPLFRAFAK